MKTAIVKMLWEEASTYRNGDNIGCLIEDMAERYHWDEEEQKDIRSALYQGLQEMSEEITTSGEGSEASIYGYSAELDCYWWSTNASFEWSADKPEFWDHVHEHLHRNRTKP